ncbi:MAG: hypothetical protein ACREOU_14750 [Candidatus Eiseniibacteriota bacterium]
MRRGVALLTCVALILTLPGCSSTKQVPLETEASRPNTGMMKASGQRVHGYTTTDGVFHAFEGYATLIGADSIGFTGKQKDPKAHSGTFSGRATKGVPAIPDTLARADVQTLFVEKNDALKTTFLVIGITVAIAAILTGIAMATKESCPFLYSFDGEQFVFDGEPYGGATMRGLERQDSSELEHLVAVDGKYRILLTNEVDETQHTNAIELLVVDHAPGLHVVLDADGRPHGFRTLTPLAAASSSTGRDLLGWLSQDDLVHWYPSLDRLAANRPLEDTREHITLEFARTTAGDSAYLVTRVATGQWGSHLIRTMLGMRGKRVGEFYEAVNGNLYVRARLLAWNDREELFHLFPEVETKGEWTRQQAFIPGGGPFVFESRAVPLDLSGVDGDRVRVRIHPPIGFWNLDSFFLAGHEVELSATVLRPAEARDQDGRDVLPLVLASDDAFLDFPTNEDRAELTFAAPPLAPGTERTIFARTRGWYEIHLHDLGEPDTAGLTALESEPGYIVRRGLEEFATFRQTGILLGTRPVAEGAR